MAVVNIERGEELNKTGLELVVRRPNEELGVARSVCRSGLSF